MSGRSRISAKPLPWQLSVVLALACLGWIPEVTSLRTTPFIGKYTREKQDSIRGGPVEEVQPEEEVTEVVVPPIREPSNTAYQVGVVAKSTATPLEGNAEGANGTAKSLYTGIPQIDYILDPNLPRELNGFNLTDYPFYVAVPQDITFKCDGLHDGFYASVPHKCQVYHHCLFGTRYDFLCANYTAFDQKTFICHFVSEVDCENSPKYYKRNEALYKAATTAAPPSTTTTTTTTTPAPSPAPQSLSQPSGGRVGAGGRKRRPYRRRRPQYEYYYEDDYAEDDDIEYSRPAQPPRRRKKKPSTTPRERPRDEEDDFVDEEEDFPDEGEYVNRRRKQKPRTRPQSSRRPIEDDFEDEYEDDPPEKTSPGVGLVPVGTPASRGKGVFDKPRAPPKIRPPVPLSEREKYNYGRPSTSASSSAAAQPSKSGYGDSEEEVSERRTKKRPSQYSPPPAGRDEDSEEELPERRIKKRPTQPPPPPARRAEASEEELPERRIKKRPTQPPPLPAGRDDHYYEDEEEEEYERIPPPRGSNQNRRRKGQGGSRVEQADSEEDDYEYKTASRDSSRYPSSSGSRDPPRRRKRPQASASSVPARRRRPSYRQEEDDYGYDDEEDTRVRSSNTRYKDTRPKASDDDEYIDRAPSRNPPSRPAEDAPTRKRVQPSNFRSSFSEDRRRPLSSVYNKRKRLPAPVHEEIDEERSSEEELEEEEEELPPSPKERARGNDRVRVVKQRISTTTTTPKPPPPPPLPPRLPPRTTTTSAPLPARDRDSFEEEDDDGDYYESEEIPEREPKLPEPVNSRRPFRPSGPINPNGGSFVTSGRSVPAPAPPAFLPRGLQALGDRAQRKEPTATASNNGTNLKPKPISYTTTTVPSVATTKAFKKEEPKYLERPQSTPSNLPSYKQQTQYNARQPTPKQEIPEHPQVTSYTRMPFVTNARPGYTTKSLPTPLYPQKPQQSIVPPHVPVDSVPNQTDYEEDDFINDALHPTIPSSSGFPVTAAATSLGTRHGISLSQQQRTTLSTPTQLTYRFRNTAQSSPILDYRAQQPANPSFTSRGAPLHTSASQQTLSIVQPPQFLSHQNQQRVELHAVQKPLQQLLQQQVPGPYQGSNLWNNPTRIVVY